jgi:hypothetical protein
MSLNDDEDVIRGETAALMKELGLDGSFHLDDDKVLMKGKSSKESASGKTKHVKSGDSKKPGSSAVAVKLSQPNPPTRPAAVLSSKQRISGDQKENSNLAKHKPESAHARKGAHESSAEFKDLSKLNKAMPSKASKPNASLTNSGNFPKWLSDPLTSGAGSSSENAEKWFDPLAAIPVEFTVALGKRREYSTALLDVLRSRYEQEVERYAAAYRSKADSKWVQQVIQSGTLSDKVAALAMQIQESPMHNLDALDTLVDMCARKEQRVAQLALAAAKDLLIHTLLPDRQLVPLHARNLYADDMSISTAMRLYFESELIHRAASFVSALEAGSMVTADYFKKICMDVAVDMLVSKPEQEARLLAIVVNKLGDPASVICTKAIESLKKILKVHPAMKSVVIREVRNFVSRPNLPGRALFSSVLFLSQIILGRGSAGVAANLVECYVSLFEKAVNMKESGSRLLSALLTGINRAYPYLDDSAPITNHLDSLFRIAHNASFSTCTQALMLISHIALNEDASKNDPADETTDSANKAESALVNRFYRALYDKLLDDEVVLFQIDSCLRLIIHSQVATRARNTLFMNLLFRSVKRDPIAARFAFCYFIHLTTLNLFFVY